ncbi:MAG TPA: glycine zipper 2TM domain-containing protein [Anaerovoracaceae bacterium]|nr:glycine zipper 2TM domain-containing protein [Anaerovoracaceae bacterium]
MKIKSSILAVGIALSMTGCAGLSGPSYSGLSVSGSQAQVQSIVELGTVLAVQPVQIEQNNIGVGTLAGAGVGGLLGSMISHGPGKAVAIIVGAVGGGAAGQALSNGAGKKDGVQLTIQKTNGQTIAIVQSGPEQFVKGERVQLVTSQGKTRVSHI